VAVATPARTKIVTSATSAAETVNSFRFCWIHRDPRSPVVRRRAETAEPASQRSRSVDNDAADW
jgi:hypothetical protein